MKHLALQLLFLVSFLLGLTEIVAASDGSDTGVALVPVSTERSVDDRRLDMEATLELASMVFKMRTAFEGVRQAFSARVKGSDRSDLGRGPLCMRCQLEPSWTGLPLGQVAPIQIERGLCSNSPETDCVTAQEFQVAVNEVLAMPLSSLERVSCRYLTGVLGIKEECPGRVGGFYSCERIC